MFCSCMSQMVECLQCCREEGFSVDEWDSSGPGGSLLMGGNGSGGSLLIGGNGSGGSLLISRLFTGGLAAQANVYSTESRYVSGSIRVGICRGGCLLSLLKIGCTVYTFQQWCSQNRVVARAQVGQHIRCCAMCGKLVCGSMLF